MRQIDLRHPVLVSHARMYETRVSIELVGQYLVNVVCDAGPVMLESYLPVGPVKFSTFILSLICVCWKYESRWGYLFRALP